MVLLTSDNGNDENNPQRHRAVLVSGNDLVWPPASSSNGRQETEYMWIFHHVSHYLGTVRTGFMNPTYQSISYLFSPK